MRSNPPLLRPALKALLGRIKAIHVSDYIYRHKADIVPVERILRSRISKADPELHRAPLCAPPQQGKGRKSLGLGFVFSRVRSVLRLQTRWRDDRRQREVAISDRGSHALRQYNRRDVNRITNLITSQ